MNTHIKKFESFANEGLHPRDLEILFKNPTRKNAESIVQEFHKKGGNSEKIDQLKAMYPNWFYRTNQDSNDFLDAYMDLLKKEFDIPEKIIPFVEDVILDEMEKELYRKHQESDDNNESLNEMDFSFVGGDVATTFEAILAISTVLLGLTGLALSTFKEDLKKAFAKPKSERGQAIKKVLVDTKEKMAA